MEKQKLKERKINPKSHIALHTSHNSGITLVALIITIIVLLILAVVAIRAVQGDGIINYAKNAQDQYAQAESNELDILSGYETTINKYVPSLEVLNKIFKGKKIFETFDGQSNFVVDEFELKAINNESIKIKDNLVESDFVPNMEVEMGGVLVTYDNSPYTIVYGVNKEYDYTDFTFNSSCQSFYGISPVILRIEEGHTIIGNAYIR